MSRQLYHFRCQWDRGLGGPDSRSGSGSSEKNLLSVLQVESRSSNQHPRRILFIGLHLIMEPASNIFVRLPVVPCIWNCPYLNSLSLERMSGCIIVPYLNNPEALKVKTIHRAGLIL
jgi:hypothetical protein